MESNSNGNSDNDNEDDKIELSYDILQQNLQRSYSYHEDFIDKVFSSIKSRLDIDTKHLILTNLIMAIREFGLPLVLVINKPKYEDDIRALLDDTNYSHYIVNILHNAIYIFDFDECDSIPFLKRLALELGIDIPKRSIESQELNIFENIYLISKNMIIKCDEFKKYLNEKEYLKETDDIDDEKFALGYIEEIYCIQEQINNMKGVFFGYIHEFFERLITTALHYVNFFNEFFSSKSLRESIPAYQFKQTNILNPSIFEDTSFHAYHPISSKVNEFQDQNHYQGRKDKEEEHEINEGLIEKNNISENQVGEINLVDSIYHKDIRVNLDEIFRKKEVIQGVNNKVNNENQRESDKYILKNMLHDLEDEANKISDSSLNSEKDLKNDSNARFIKDLSNTTMKNQYEEEKLSHHSDFSHDENGQMDLNQGFINDNESKDGHKITNRSDFDFNKALKDLSLLQKPKNSQNQENPESIEKQIVENHSRHDSIHGNLNGFNDKGPKDLKPKSNNDLKPINQQINLNKLDDFRFINPSQRTSFIYNEIIQFDEDRTIEFKMYKFPFNQINHRQIKVAICAFLNNKGGRIYIGINDYKMVKGIRLSAKDRDNLKLEIHNMLKKFYPDIKDLVKVVFVPIRDEKGVEYAKHYYVVKIIVKQGDPDRLYSCEAHNFISYFRIDGACINLLARQIEDEIIRRRNNPDPRDVNDSFNDPPPEKPLDERVYFVKNYGQY